MPLSDSSTPKYWVVVTCVVAAPLCLFAALQAILILLYGVEVLWGDIPEASDRGPGDGFFMLLVPPLALVLWLVSVGIISAVASRRRVRLAERARSRRAA